MAGLLQRLQQQNFGPNDSVIASGLMHPQDGLLKIGKWFQDNVNTAAGIPNISNQDEASIYAYGPTDEQKVEAANNLSGLLQTSAFASGAAPASAGGTLGTFIGPKSMGWNQEAANTATKLLDNGADPAQVWKDHLIGRMPDNSLFSEIDDSGARLLPDRVKENKGIPSYLLDSLNHPDFNKNYDINEPAFININDYFKSPSGSYSGEGYGKGFVIDAPDYNTGASTALHELQHAIQQREGWARGGSPDDFPAVNSTALIKESNDLYKLLNSDYAKELEAAQETGDFKNIIKIRNKNLDEYNKIGDVFHRFKTTNLEEARNKALDLGNTLTPREQYLRLTGEAQARATQDRMNMNMQQRRDNYPLAGGLLSDIPLDQLINRYR